jgi:hypothetical protein
MNIEGDNRIGALPHGDQAVVALNASQPQTLSGIRLTTVVIVAIVAMLYVALPNGVPDFRADQEHDSFTYIILSKSLVSGNGYPTKHWMPGFPAMLGITIRWVGEDWLRLKLAMIGLSLVTLFIVRQLYARVASPQHATPLALVLAVTPLYYDYSHRLMSEVPFLTLSSLALLAFCELSESAGSWRRLSWAVVLSLSAAGAVMIRGNALALLPALLIEVFRRRETASLLIRGGAIAAFITLIATYGAWSWRCSNQQYHGIDNVTYLQEVCADDIGKLWEAGSYSDGVARIGLSGLANRFYQNSVWYQSYRIAELIVPSAGRLASISFKGLGLGLAALCLIPVALGAISLRKTSPYLFTYLVFSIIIMLVYPTGGSARMLMPAIPLLIVCGYLGLRRIFGAAMAGGWLVCLIAANVVASAVAGDLQRKHPYTYDEFSKFVEIVVEDIPRHSKPGDVIQSYYPLVTRALSGLESRDPAEATSTDAPSTLRIEGPRIIAGIRYPEVPQAGSPRSGAVLASRGPFRLIRMETEGGGGGR